MKKICIIGSGGAGKSTLSFKLSEILNIPVIHLDTLFWKPGWKETSKPEFIKKVKKVIDSNATWIIEGNYRSTFSVRFGAADTIIFLDYKRHTCVRQSFKRFFMYRKKTRPDMTEGCYERLDYAYFKWIWGFPKKYRPGVLNVLDLVKDSVNVIILKNKKEADKFLEGLK